MELNKIYHGHVLDILKQWSDNSIDLIVTSPPYWQLRKYSKKDHETIWGGSNTCDHQWSYFFKPQKRGHLGSGWKRPSRIHNPTTTKIKCTICKKCGAYKGELGLEPTFTMYIDHLQEVFEEVYRILSKYGSLYVVISDTYSGSGDKHYATNHPSSAGKQKYLYEYQSFPQSRSCSKSMQLPKKCLCGIPERFSIMMTDKIGFIKRNTIIWHKPNALPDSQKDRFTVDFEYVYFFTKNKKYYHLLQKEPCNHSISKHSKKQPTNTLYRTKRTVWSINTKPLNKPHFATFPELLIEPIIRASAPKEVCTKCGKPKFPIYIKKSIIGSSKIKTKSKYLDYEPNPKFLRKNSIGKDGTTVFNIGWKQCNCNAPFRKGIVADIFMGSGTTAVVARRLGFDWVGIELVDEYIDIAYDRLAQQTL